MNYRPESFERHFDMRGNTLILAPRQSGKTWTLLREFCNTPHSAFFNPYNPHYEDACRLLREAEQGEQILRMGIMAQPDLIRGRRVETVFVDEIDHYQGDLAAFFERISPSLDVHSGKVIAVTTPQGRNMGIYERFFPNILHLDDVAQKQEHFEEELFRI